MTDPSSDPGPARKPSRSRTRFARRPFARGPLLRGPFLFGIVAATVEMAVILYFMYC